MKINKRTKVVVGALALTGALGLAGGAFTATGIATSGTAAAPQFVGGQVSQTVTGATLNEIKYGFTNATHTSINAVTLTFTDANADGQSVTVDTGGGTSNWSCENVGATTTGVSTCSATAPETGVSNIDVVVSSTF